MVWEVTLGFICEFYVLEESRVASYGRHGLIPGHHGRITCHPAHTHKIYSGVRGIPWDDPYPCRTFHRHLSLFVRQSLSINNTRLRWSLIIFRCLLLKGIWRWEVYSVTRYSWNYRFNNLELDSEPVVWEDTEYRAFTQVLPQL